MTPKEFKAWFEGFTEEIRTPTKAQWARIKTRVADIDGVEITEKIYLDRYWPYQVWPSYTALPTYVPTTPTLPYVVTSPYVTTCGGIGSSSGAQFSSTSAMYVLGKNEAMAVS